MPRSGNWGTLQSPSALPFGIAPYLHDDENFDDFRSATGHFLHFPVMHMYIKDLDFRLVAQWARAFADAGAEREFYLWLFHPYEIMNEDKTCLDPGRMALLRSQIVRFADEHGMTFASMAECRAMLVREEE